VALVVTVEALLNGDLGDDGVSSFSFINESDRNGPRIFGGTGFAVTSVDVVRCVVSVSVGVVGGLLLLTFSPLSCWLSLGGVPCGFGAGTCSIASGVGVDAVIRLSVFEGAGPDTVVAVCCSFVVGFIVTGVPLIP
jgi:hypothetical protein